MLANGSNDWLRGTRFPKVQILPPADIKLLKRSQLALKIPKNLTIGSYEQVRTESSTLLESTTSFNNYQLYSDDCPKFVSNLDLSLKSRINWISNPTSSMCMGHLKLNMLIPY